MFKAFPPRNAVSFAMAKMNDDEKLWTTDSYILANIFDVMNSLMYVTLCSLLTKGDRKPDRPKPHPRPGRVGKVAKVSNFPGKTVYVKD
jgi:hypothetical protein